VQNEPDVVEPTAAEGSACAKFGPAVGLGLRFNADRFRRRKAHRRGRGNPRRAWVLNGSSPLGGGGSARDLRKEKNPGPARARDNQSIGRLHFETVREKRDARGEGAGGGFRIFFFGCVRCVDASGDWGSWCEEIQRGAAGGQGGWIVRVDEAALKRASNEAPI